MIDIFSQFLHQLITLLAIIDPLGVSAILLSLAPNSMTSVQIKEVAKKATFTIIIAFFVVFFTGNLILSLFGLSLEAVKVMGGIVLLLMGIKMVEGSLTEPPQRVMLHAQKLELPHPTKPARGRDRKGGV